MSDIAINRRLDDLESLLERLRKSDVARVIWARAYNSANLSINNNTFTTLTLDSERYDNAGIHSTSSNTSRLTCQLTGWYVITAQGRFATNATGLRSVRIVLNGVTVLAVSSCPAVTGTQTDIACTSQYYLTVADYIEMQAYQNSGGNLNVETAANISPELMMVSHPSP